MKIGENHESREHFGERLLWECLSGGRQRTAGERHALPGPFPKSQDRKAKGCKSVAGRKPEKTTKRRTSSVARRSRTRASGWGLRRSILAHSPQSRQITTQSMVSFPVWTVLPLWGLAITFPFPLNQRGKGRVRLVFGYDHASEASLAPQLGTDLAPARGRRRPLPLRDAFTWGS